MDSWVQAVDEVLTEKEFMGALKEFTQKHCEVFEASDENKLEYTPLFEKYAHLVEQYVDRRLVEKGVDLEKFMADLPAYIDSADAHPRTGAVLELLTSFDSFVAFKDMMLEAKKSLAADTDETKDSQQSFGADLSSVTFLKEKVRCARRHIAHAGMRARVQRSAAGFCM
jgi:ADP-ribosylation factor 2-binding protein